MSTQEADTKCPRCGHEWDEPDWRCPKCYYEFGVSHSPSEDVLEENPDPPDLSPFGLFCMAWKTAHGKGPTLAQFWAATQKKGEARSVVKHMAEYNLTLENVPTYEPGVTTYREKLVRDLEIPEKTTWQLLDAFDIKNEVPSLDSPMLDAHAILLGIRAKFSLKRCFRRFLRWTSTC